MFGSSRSILCSCGGQLKAARGCLATSQQWRDKSSETEKKRSWKPKIVIFDKNGTLINFNSPWVPWAKSFSQRIEERTGLVIKDDLLSHLDVCLFTNKVKSGILAHGTSNQIKAEVRSFLRMRGMGEQEAWDVVGKSWKECDTSDQQTLQEVANLKAVFQKLIENDMRIAVCTSDGRRTTERTLGTLRLLPYVDILACGDDGSALPKPHPNSVNHICETLALSPRDAVVIGDTESDMLMGVQAGVGMNIGVLSGIGTRLELINNADVVTESVQEALPLILNPPITHTAPRKPHAQGESKASVVIFDKDGTLLCFHSMWTPWAEQLIKRLEKDTGLQLYERVMEELGYCHRRQKWTPGVFAEGTVSQNMDRVVGVLQTEGLDSQAAEEAVKRAWKDSRHTFSEDNLKLLDNPKALFKVLKENGVKIAICTADSRPGTLKFVESIGATDYVDLVVCGDDPKTEPKPSPHNAIAICEQLNVDPSRAVVVGDTIADMGMGRSARLGATVGVLSGVGNVEDLQDHADHVIPSVKDILPLVIAKRPDGTPKQNL